jgi:cytochrome c biogenesis protein CcmG/thiol:disulfide interchange protein DsbE
LRNFNLVAILILSLGGFWIWVSTVPPGKDKQPLLAAPQVGFQAPDFTLDSFENEEVKLTQYRGHPVIINLWASWCPPCRAEMPALQRVSVDYRNKGLVILGINVTNQDSLENAQLFVSDNHLTFPILLDVDGRVSRLYQLHALPTSYFVDRNGVVRDEVIGGPMSEALLRVRVDGLLKDLP